MSSLKKIGIVLGLGGVVVIGYYFLSKTKPTIATQQLAQLSNTSVTSITEQLDKPLSIEDKLIEDKCSGLSRSDAEKCAQGIRNASQGVLSNVPISVVPLRANTVVDLSNIDVLAPVTTAPPRGTAPTGTRVVSGGRRL